jgi:hypothetical protein
VEPNIVAVLIAALVPMVLGAVWYSSLMFGKQWMKLMGKTEEELKAGFSPLKTYGLSFVMYFVMAYVLGHFVIYATSFTGSSGFGAGMQAGFWAWLGFVFTTSVITMLYESRKSGIVWINALYNLVSLLLMGGILAAWR